MWNLPSSLILVSTEGAATNGQSGPPGTSFASKGYSWLVLAWICPDFADALLDAVRTSSLLLCSWSQPSVELLEGIYLFVSALVAGELALDGFVMDLGVHALAC